MASVLPEAYAPGELLFSCSHVIIYQTHLIIVTALYYQS